MKIVIIGCGNVGNFLAESLPTSSFQIVQVYNRHIRKAKRLASKIGCDYTGSLRRVTKDADLYFLTVSDSAIGEVASQLKTNDALVVHCSGATDIDILKNHHDRCAVIWPIETIKQIQETHSKAFTLLWETSEPTDSKMVLKLAKSLTRNFHQASSEARLQYHLGAVLVNNYVNYLYTLAEEFLSDAQLDFSLLYPIIQSTAKGILLHPPKSLQTGPASRNDLATIKKHKAIIQDNETLKKVYDILYHCIKEQEK